MGTGEVSLPYSGSRTYLALTIMIASVPLNNYPCMLDTNNSFKTRIKFGGFFINHASQLL